MAGFFDACGDLNIQLVPSAVHGLTRSPGGNTSGERIVDNKLVVSVTHKNHDLLVIYKEIFGGNINLNRNDRFI